MMEHNKTRSNESDVALPSEEAPKELDTILEELASDCETEGWEPGYLQEWGSDSIGKRTQEAKEAIKHLLAKARKQEAIEELEKIKRRVDLAGTGGGFRLDIAEMAPTLEESKLLTGENDTIYRKEVGDYVLKRLAELKGDK